MKFLKRAIILLCVVVGLGMLFGGGKLREASNGAYLDRVGSSTVALVISVPDDDPTSKESEVKAYCTGVWVDSIHMLTADHCVEMVLEHMQAVQDAKEKAWLEAPPCEGVALMFGLCESHDAMEHRVLDMHDINIYYLVYHEVNDKGGDPSAVHLSHVLNTDKLHDLALLEAYGTVLPSHAVAKIAKKDPSELTPLVLVGHPKGYYWTFLNASVAGYRGNMGVYEGSPYMQVQGPGATNGNSGGGAFDMEGQLVGLADFGTKSLPSQIFYVDADNLRYFVHNTLAKK